MTEGDFQLSWCGGFRNSASTRRTGEAVNVITKPIDDVDAITLNTPIDRLLPR
jgi:hypothetical protein